MDTNYTNDGVNDIKANDTEINHIPEEYRPISAWGYFGYQILFILPIVGFILLLVFSLSSNVNHNLRNFARSHFCFLAIYAVLMVISLLIRAITSLV